MNYVYVLKVDKKGEKNFYVGCTQDLQKRIAEHQKGNVRTTKDRNPTLLYYEAFSKRHLAYKREKSLKTSGSVYNALMRRLELKK